MTKAEKAERDETIQRLRDWLKPGDTLYTVLRHVSRSGMQRRIDVYKVDADGPQYLSGYVARALGRRIDQSKGEGIVCGGAGMDMGFELVYSLSSVLFPLGFDCIGDSESPSQRCPSNDHRNGDRNYAPHLHQSGGYALRQRWM